MTVPFTKMHGAGNDFVVFDATRENITITPARARFIADRRFGIGCDQLLVIAPSDIADYKMLIYNADGGEVEMCGNGVRCFYLYCRTHGLTDKDALAVETLGGVVTPRGVEGGVRVDMGAPVFDGRRIPVDADGDIIGHALDVDGATYDVSCVSMGNPHCVVRVDDVDGFDVPGVGARIEHHPFFPERVNVEFIQVVDNAHVTQRTWERGAGETLACGTGASATAVIGARRGWTGREVTVSLPGGDLHLEWAADNHVYLTGPAAEVFSGEIEF